jgi:hypothetical protein
MCDHALAARVIMMTIRFLFGVEGQVLCSGVWAAVLCVYAVCWTCR